ncbi:hypothetical protein BGZ99_000317 [Dissophora globulifera]|uniref:Uncharacterized protein n=1 Tax=Dissophora globulifera TaxID=979702 RepID=A0A9P6RSE8_9FUNG|nr:hypothetical protein BGZ99_000317 [Dissophora globulifera]
MSDGNLRFKCRPPVSMSLICNKSYSESKIRNMIAGVVYGHTLPDSGTPTSGSSENVLAFAPPPLPKSPRRPSLKDDLSELARESSAGSEHQQSFEEMNINGGHPHPIDDRRSPHGDMTRRPSVQPLCRRPTSAGGEDSPMMDYEDSTMPPPSSHLQVPGTPPLEGDDPRLYRPHFTHPPRSVIPTAPSAASGSLSAATRQGQKLQHSHSHPNIGQKRHQQFLEQQEQQRANHAYSSQSPQYYAQQQQQQRHLQRQVMRRESTQYYNAAHSRPVTAERRFSHPAALQPSSSARFLSRSHSGDGNSPAISSRSPPNYESLHQALGQANTPQVGPVSGLGNSFEDVNSPSYYQRRMSQPHPSVQRSYSQLPPPPPGATAHPHDRHTSGTEDFNYQHRQKYEKLNANTIRPPTALSTGSKMYMTPHSSQVLNSECSTLSTQNLMSQSTHSAQSEPMRFSHSLPVSSHEPNHHVYSRQPSREYMTSSEPYAPEALVHEETNNHPYSGMRHGHQKSNTGHSLARMRSQPNLSKSNHTSARDLDAAIARNTIKLTCFPNTVSSYNAADRSSVSLDTSDAMAMRLGQSSKVVIEITQPRQLQVFKPSRSASFASFEHVPGPLNERKSLRHTASQPNLLMRSGTSVLGRRRSASPDGVAFGSSKKRRADSTSRSRDEDDSCSSEIPSASASAAAASAAAAAVVAAAANAARQQQQQTGIKKGSSSAAQLASLDHDSLEKALGGSHQAGLGLGVHVSGTESMLEFPAIETLKIANISSFVALEDQKDLGIDCSLFTRVETAAWRILIPPNVEASFRSEDFGLTLRPKLVDSVAAADVPEEPTDIAKLQGAQVAMETDDVEVRIDDGGKREVEKEARTVAGRPDATELSEQREANDQDSTALKSVSETEEEMDELEDE